jgi:hypothetical protein
LDPAFSSQPTAEFDATPAFIKTVNTDPDVTGVLHVGDIHSGSEHCTQSYDRSIFNLWTAFEDPMVYTPGDNEWSDCQKTKELGSNPADNYAGGNPADNLALLRSTFFPQPGRTLGQHSMPVTSEAEVGGPHPSDSQYVENVMWERRGVVFVTLNIPGGSNDDSDPWFGSKETDAQKAQQSAERDSRDTADLDWIDAAFAQANTDDARAVVVIEQADMWDPEQGPSRLSNYDQFISSIAGHTQTFGKPVLLFNGDSHVYRSDDPLTDNSTCRIENGSTDVACRNDDYDNNSRPGYNVPSTLFHRITVHGSTFPLEWLKLTIHDNGHLPAAGNDSFGPFSWQREVQSQLTPMTTS